MKGLTQGDALCGLPFPEGRWKPFCIHNSIPVNFYVRQFSIVLFFLSWCWIVSIVEFVGSPAYTGPRLVTEIIVITLCGPFILPG